jgi:hypothetical protein
MQLDCDNLVPVDDQIMHLTKLIHNNPDYFQEKRFLIMGETRLLRLYKKWTDEDDGYITTVDRLGKTRGSALDVMTKLEFIVDELFLATILGFFERDKRLEESRLDVRAKILILKGFGKIDEDLANVLSLLFATRNGLAHAWSINHVEYAGKGLLDNFDSFRQDLNGVWLKMIQIYRRGQEPTIGAFIQRIENEIADP